MDITSDRAVEPEIQDLMRNLRRMQQGKNVLEEELTEVLLLRDVLLQERDALHAEFCQLEATHREKEEICKVLQFKCEGLELESKRKLQQNSKSEKLIEQYTFQIKETKIKHRRLRIKFEDQLQELMDQHKSLSSVYAPERLPVEIESFEKANAQLLKVEQGKLKQLSHLTDKINQARGPDLTMADRVDTANSEEPALDLGMY